MIRSLFPSSCWDSHILSFLPVFSFLSSLLPSLPPAFPFFLSFSFSMAEKRHGTKRENEKLDALVRFWDYKIVTGNECYKLPRIPVLSLFPVLLKILSSRENNIGLHCLFLKFQSIFKTVDSGGKAAEGERTHWSVSDQYQLWIQTVPTN